MDTRDQAPHLNVNAAPAPETPAAEPSALPAAAPEAPPVPPAPLRRPAPAASGARQPPSLGAVFRGILFLVGAAAALVVAGRRWADAYARYRSFHGDVPAPFLAVPEAPPPAAADVPAEEPAAKQPREVVFHLNAPQAKAVLLGGSFNDFDARDTPLTRRPDGAWEATLTLPPGRYFYKFKVDGRWTLDPANPERRTGAGEASILDIQ